MNETSNEQKTNQLKDSVAHTFGRFWQRNYQVLTRSIESNTSQGQPSQRQSSSSQEHEPSS